MIGLDFLVKRQCGLELQGSVCSKVNVEETIHVVNSEAQACDVVSVFPECLVCQRQKDCVGTSSPEGLNDGVSRGMNVGDSQGQADERGKERREGGEKGFVQRRTGERGECARAAGERGAQGVEEAE
jgi:hypothetical protein